MSKRKQRYRLYVDESGVCGDAHANTPHDRYLAILGLWFQCGEPYDQFSAALQAFKDDFWGSRYDDPVILHRDDIIKRRKWYKILQDEETRDSFNSSLLDIVRAARFRLTCVVIDKENHRNRYGDRALHPYHYCLQALLERYCGWLAHVGAEGDVLAEARGRREDRQLAVEYNDLYHQGTFYSSPLKEVLTSNKLKLKSKDRNTPGLQLADILVHPAKMMMLERRRIVAAREGPFATPIRQIIGRKYNRHTWDGRIDGYGRVYLSF